MREEVKHPRFRMPPRPRLPFCWECGRKLYGTIHATVLVDGVERIVHKGCAEGLR